jgi:hypothetical protein
VGSDHSRLAPLYLNRFLDSRHTLVSEPLHFLRIMDEGPERSHGGTVRDGFFNHLDGTLYAKAKTVFVCK